MFTFDVDAAIGNGGNPLANPANPANPILEKPPISKISKISNPLPPFSVEQRAELVRLVNRVADHHGFTTDQRQEALDIALNDPTAALECFRALAARIPQPITRNGEV